MQGGGLMVSDVEQTNGHDPVADLAATVAAEIFDSGQGEKAIREYRMENGVVLRIKPVPPMVLRNASRAIVDPLVPKAWIASKEREEENPDDPQYIRDLDDARQRRSMAAQTAALLVGTEVKTLPAGVPGPDDDSWIEDLRAVAEASGAEFTVHDVKGSKARYLDWLRLYAIGSDVELFILTKILTIGVALTNSEVQAAAESFRRLVARTANLEPEAPEPPVDWDPVPAGDPGDGGGI